MNYKTILATVVCLIYFFSIASKAEEDTRASIDELKGKVEGIDENVLGLLSDVAGLKKLKISGYMQIQFEKTEANSGFSMNPYDSSDYVLSRFRVRRARIKTAYDAGLTQFVIQGDFSNTGFTLKDAYMSITDPWTKYFSLTTGVFNRPNFEVEYSSSQRESMERSTVIKKLYPDERDLGAMITVNPNDLFKFQFAAFNNTFLGDLKQTNPNYSSEPLYYMARITKELYFTEAGLGIDFGAHARFGSIVANTNKIIESENNSKVVDTSSVKEGDKLGRNWFGFEAQLYYDFLGGLKLMGEYIMGSDIDQISTAEKTPSAIRKRNFSGYYVMLVKNVTTDFQVALKYDSYNPNTKIAEADITSKSDLATNTFGFGLHNYTFSNIRISLWYDMIKTQTHEKVLPNDPSDNLLTLRFQYKF